ncbi:MAG: HAMP domain-containing histidine kinase [Lachnospiraceae bacterium]|nr:HAMP domain-containing histidine kinase [Lachnospiraceae bacterium]
MKQLIRILAVYTVLMIAALLVFRYEFDKSEYKGRDIVYYNDCLLSMYDGYLAGTGLQKLEDKYDCRIIFSKNLVDDEMTDYYKRGALVLDFSPGGDYLGKVIWDDTTGYLNAYRRSTQQVMLLFWAVVLAAGYVFVLIVWWCFIRPVRRLSSFSSRIAKGDLDFPLPASRDNLFEGFTESFDMMREELKKSRQREVEADLAKKEMVAALSHDIKTPVATIRATCEVLSAKYQRKAEREKDPEVADTLEKITSISAKAETIDRLMNNMSSATLEEQGRIEVNPVERLSSMIEDYIGNLKNSGSGSTVIMDNHIPECLLYMDSLRMEQVIDNVIGNSRKYAGTDIHVSFDRVSGGYVRIRISDSGPGVSDADLPLITEKYYRGKESADKGGYGLGMYLVKLYMEKQGGGVEYYNDNGFTVELLLKRV